MDKQDPPCSPIDYAYMKEHNKLGDAMDLFGNHNLLVIECCKRGLSNLLLNAFGFSFNNDGTLRDDILNDNNQRKVKLIAFNFNITSEDNDNDIYVESSIQDRRALFNTSCHKTTLIAIQDHEDKNSQVNFCKGDRFFGYKQINYLNKIYWIVSHCIKNGPAKILKKQDLEYMLVPECYLEPLDYIVNWTRSSTKVRKSDQNTALHIAAKYGNRTIVELLLKLGWSTKLKNAKGMTPGDMARSAKNLTLGEKIDFYGMNEKNLFDAFELVENQNMIINSLRNGYAIERDFYTGKVALGLPPKTIRFGPYVASDAKNKGIVEKISVIEAHHVIKANNVKILKKRGDVFDARAKSINKKGIPFYIYNDKKIIPVSLTEMIIPRYKFEWIDRINNMTILDMAEMKAEEYTKQLKLIAKPGIPSVTKEDSSSIYEAVKRANNIVQLLYLKGWSHYTSHDHKKNHNLLLIYAMQYIENCHETLLDYLNRGMMIRYKPDFDNEGDLYRNFLYNLKDKNEYNQIISIPSPVGMQKVIYKHANTCEMYFVFETFEPFKLKPVIRGAKSQEDLKIEKYDERIKSAQTKFLKLDKIQPNMCYAPDYCMQGTSGGTLTALDVINRKIECLEKVGMAPKAQLKNYRLIRALLIDRGWADWETALSKAEDGLVEVKKKMDGYTRLRSTESIVGNPEKIANLQKMIDAAKRRNCRIEAAKSELMELNEKDKVARRIIRILQRHALLNRLKS